MHRSPAGAIVSVVCLALLSIARPVARAGADYLRIFGEDAGVNAVRVAVGAVFAF